MSMCYWAITGLGVNVDEIACYLDFDKICHTIKAIDSEWDIDAAISAKEARGNTHNEALVMAVCEYGEDTNSLAEVLYKLSDSSWANDGLTWISDGNCGEGDFLLIEPVYPWSITPYNPPTTFGDAVEVVFNAIKPYIKDGDESRVKDKIDYIDTYGCG